VSQCPSKLRTGPSDTKTEVVSGEVGAKVIHHRANLRLTHPGYCNDKQSLGNHPVEMEKLAARFNEYWRKANEVDTELSSALSSSDNRDGITAMTALREAGCARLAARIYELKKDGYLISKRMIK